MSDIIESLTQCAVDCHELLLNAAEEIEFLNKVIEVERKEHKEAIEAERKKHEWVSVNDRLPEEWKEVIACDENAVVYPQARWFFGRRHDERIWEWAYEAGMDYWVSVDAPVTHWIPLPEPPKGGEEE